MMSSYNFGIDGHGLPSSTQKDVPTKSSVWKSDGLKPGSSGSLMILS